MAELGLAGAKLQDGIDIADRLVRAPLEAVLAHFGRPLLVARDGEQQVEVPPEGIVMWAANDGDTPWTTVEDPDSRSIMMNESGQDYLVPLFEQGIAALEGRIPDLEPCYENPLGTASEVARALKTDAIALWGSDEWVGICGGAHIGEDGEILRAYSDCSVEEIRRCAASRARMIADEEDDDDLDDISDHEDRGAFMYVAGGGVTQAETDAMTSLDAMLRELGAAQPFDPITLWGMWPPRGEVWVALG